MKEWIKKDEYERMNMVGWMNMKRWIWKDKYERMNVKERIYLSMNNGEKELIFERVKGWINIRKGETMNKCKKWWKDE